jgi:hypothetical protein
LVELTSLKLDFNPKLNRVPKRVRIFMCFYHPQLIFHLADSQPFPD